MEKWDNSTRVSQSDAAPLPATLDGRRSLAVTARNTRANKRRSPRRGSPPLRLPPEPHPDYEIDHLIALCLGESAAHLPPEVIAALRAEIADFVLTDEIVSGLDVSTQAQVLRLLKELTSEMRLALAFTFRLFARSVSGWWSCARAEWSKKVHATGFSLHRAPPTRGC